MQNNITFFISFISFIAFLAPFWTSLFSNPAFRLTNEQKAWFDSLETEWQKPFKDLANLNDEEMKSVVDTISEMKKHCFDWLFQKENRKSFHHDTNIPKNIMKKIHTILKKYGINPYRIDIHFHKNSTWLAAANDSVKLTNHLVLAPPFHNSSNPKIIICKSLYDKNDDIFENTILHECGHLAEAHNGQTKLLKNILLKKNIDAVAIDRFFKRFTCVIELIADQRLTIGNENNVDKMMAEYGGFLRAELTIIKKIANFLSINFRDCLKIDYDKGYPSDSTRFTALQMMRFALSKDKQAPTVMS